MNIKCNIRCQCSATPRAKRVLRVRVQDFFLISKLPTSTCAMRARAENLRAVIAGASPKTFRCYSQFFRKSIKMSEISFFNFQADGSFTFLKRHLRVKSKGYEACLFVSVKISK